MNITELSVKRPTAIIMLVVLFVSLGVMGYMNLGTDLFPSSNTPIMSVSTTYAGASSEEIEKDIVKPIEDAISGISGIDTLRSYSEDGYGYSIIQFSMSTDTNTAVIDVQKAIESIAGKLPKDASKPVMHKFDLNMQPILLISISGSSTYEQLYNTADNLKKTLEHLPGVGNTSMEGELKKELTVNIDKTALEYYNISLNTVLARLQAENMNIPAGEIKQEAKNQTVRVLGEFQDIDEIKKLFIPVSGGGMVHLSDIADVKLDYPDPDELIRLNGKASIGLTVQKQSDANVVVTANRVKAEIDKIRRTLPAGMELTIASDSTTFINSSVNETKRNLIEGVFTTALVLLLFLRRWKSSLIVMIAIPTSLISTFFMMYLFKFTFNLLSLLGLAMCVGILVDDSIVVLENISRHINMGKDPKEAAVEGRKEIGMAAIAITLCDVVVFAPVAFMTDMVGQFFRQFGLTVVFATLFSLFISFTLTPMLSSRMLKKSPDEATAEGTGKKKRFSHFSSFFDDVVTVKYRDLLLWSLSNRWKVVCVVVLGVTLSIALIPMKFIEAEFLPGFDQSKLIINVSLTSGSPLNKTDDKVKQVEEYLHSLPEVKDFYTAIGKDNTSSAGINIKLVDKSKRKKSQNQLAREIRAWGNKLTGVEFSVSEPSIVEQTSIDGAKPIILNITGPDKDVLKQLSGKIEQVVKSVSGVVDISNSITSSSPEISVHIDRTAASAYGISAYDIAAVMRTAVEGTKTGVYRKNGDEYDIIVKFDENQLKTAYDIGSIKVSSPAGQQIPLQQVAKIGQSDSPQEILRLDRQNLVTISANTQGRALGSVNSEIKEKLKAVNIPYGYEIEFGGDQKNMTSSFDSLIKALIASVLLVYMILVVLYESYLTPFIRMLSLPCGIIGALSALAITGKSLNLVSMIGLIMLDGLVSKNGTLLIDYTNTLVKRGMPLREALVEAGVTRLRPIIMTSFTMIVGMLPLALSLGDGSELKSGMAVALVGGLVVSTALSPLLLPVAYTLLDDLGNFIKNRRKGNTAAQSTGI